METSSLLTGVEICLGVGEEISVLVLDGLVGLGSAGCFLPSKTECSSVGVSSLLKKIGSDS